MAEIVERPGVLRTILIVAPRTPRATLSSRMSGLGAVRHPLWPIQAAARIPGSKLVDAAADDLSYDQIELLAKGFELAAIFADRGSRDCARPLAERLKGAYPDLKLVLAGERENGENFDLAVAAMASGARENAATGTEDFLASVEIIHRDLQNVNYQVPFLRFPHLSLLSGCGRRRMSPERIVKEARKALSFYPNLKEIYLEDDSLMNDPARAMAVGEGLRFLGIAWSCRGSVDAPPELLGNLRDRGLRLLAVDFESLSREEAQAADRGLSRGSAASKDVGAASRRKAVTFARKCRSLGLRLHGDFLLGRPGETRQSIRTTIRFACDLELDTIHIDTRRPPPSSKLDEEDILRSLFRMYARFYLRPKALWRSLRSIWRHPHQRRRRLRIGRKFIRFLWNGPEEATAA